VEGCRLRHAIAKGAVITYDDVVLPTGRLADRLRAEQYLKFRGEAWLSDLLDGTQPLVAARRAVDGAGPVLALKDTASTVRIEGRSI
jgi:hypothetical protein